MTTKLKIETGSGATEFNYDKRIVPGCKVKILKSFSDCINEIHDMIGQTYVVQNIGSYPDTNDPGDGGNLKINEWYFRFDEVEFVEELTIKDFKVGMLVQIKTGVATYSDKFYPNGRYIVSKVYAPDEVDDNGIIMLTDTENNELEFNPHELEIVSYPPKAEEPEPTQEAPVQNNNLKIEFFNKNTGVVLQDDFYLSADLSVWEYQYHTTGIGCSEGMEDVSDTIGFRIIVKG